MAYLASALRLDTTHGDQGAPQPWFVVNSHPHREHIVLENLKRQEFAAYCPMVRRRRSHARRVTEVLRPLFPGYLFVRHHGNGRHWRPILSTYGVRALVRCGEQLSFIDHEFVESLIRREVDGAITRPASPYQVGQQVKLTHHAFDGLVATIIEMDEKDRLTVLLDLLRRPVKIKVNTESVFPI